MKYLLSLIILLSSTAIYADQNKKQKDMAELLSLMNMDSMVDSMYSQLELMMQDMSVQMGIKSQEQPLYDEYHSKMTLV